MARRGAGRLRDDRASGASAAWRAAAGEFEEAKQPRPARRPTSSPFAGDDDIVLVEPIGAEASRAVARGRGRSQAAVPALPEDLDDEVLAEQVRSELSRAVEPGRVARYERRLADASRAFRAERFQDAARILKKLADDAPGAAAVRELYGLTLYRQEKWRAAVKELEAFHLLTGSTEQHPVLADCYRALRRWDRVDELWRELREASPSAELVTEGRIVQAGSLADRGDVAAAVALLEQGWRFPRRPREHHLRRAYALADAYERAGDLLRAREHFARIAAVDPEFADVASRVRALR